MTLFDRYVVVDWSAKARPATGADSIWIADLAGTGQSVLHNPPTRSAAMSLVEAIADDASTTRTLLGFDASLGYPSGTAALFGLDGVPWAAMWRRLAELVGDDDRNRNDRFRAAATLNAAAGGSAPGPFWGAPSDAFEPVLRRTKPAAFPVDEFRLVERTLMTLGMRPKSCWQLLGAGSVGGQTMTLLPRLARIVDRVAVWPFSTGVRVPDGPLVVAEVWPSMFVDRSDRPGGQVLDAAQVTSTAQALRAADRAGELAGWFTPEVSDPCAVVAEEGWILGVATRKPPG